MADCNYKIVRNKILVIIGSNRELINISFAKIYTTGLESNSWLYSDLQGYLCFILDHSAKCRFFILFDSVSYEKLFQFELYSNFEKSWQELASDFFCFEFSNGFIGFKFRSIDEAKSNDLCVKKFNESLCQMLHDSYASIKNNMIKGNKLISLYYSILKEKFCPEKSKYDENYIEEGLEICKPKYFDLINNFSYDTEKKEFVIGNIPEHLKKTFKNVGVKKKHFKNRQLALNIFRNLIESTDESNSLNNTKNLSKRLTKITKLDMNKTTHSENSESLRNTTYSDSNLFLN